MTTLTAAPDLDRLLDDDTERVCEAWVLPLFEALLGGNERKRCGDPAHWIAGGLCERHGVMTVLLCDECRECVVRGWTVCGRGCDRKVTLTWTEPLR